MFTDTSSKQIFGTIAGTASLLAVQFSHAVFVPSPGGERLSGTTAAASPDLAGIVLRDVLIPLEITDTINNEVFLSGVLQDRVVRSNNTGELIYAPRLRDLTTTRPGSFVREISIGDFKGFPTGIYFRIDGLGDVGPSTVFHGELGAGHGILNFVYDPGMFPPEDGTFLSVLTNATEFDTRGGITIFAKTPTSGFAFNTRLTNIASPVAVPAAA